MERRDSISVALESLAAGLVHLKGLSELSFLDHRGTQVTDAGNRHARPSDTRLASMAKIPAFSVRGLIVAVLVIGIWLGWLVRGARIQRDAVAAIERGGWSTYDLEWTNGNILPAGKPSARMARDLIGVDYFGHVTDVWLHSRSMATDGAMAQIGCLTRIQRLLSR